MKRAVCMMYIQENVKTKKKSLLDWNWNFRTKIKNILAKRGENISISLYFLKMVAKNMKLLAVYYTIREATHTLKVFFSGRSNMH